LVAGVLITLREGLETFLVVGILLGILSKMNQSDKN
jgi:high-affinity iron transporter